MRHNAPMPVLRSRADLTLVAAAQQAGGIARSIKQSGSSESGANISTPRP